MDILAFAFEWDPGIRGVLMVMVGFVVLCGSVWLILATNVGVRLGTLIAIAGFWGWMVIMGITWALYGIGYVGDGPAWNVEDVVVGDIGASRIDEARVLTTENDWREVSADNKERGDAQAVVDDLLRNDANVSPYIVNGVALDYVAVDGFIRGGKPGLKDDNPNPNRIDRIVYELGEIVRLPLGHPTKYAVIQVQEAVHLDLPFGEVAPPLEADPSQPIVSVVLIRDLGNRRLPPVLVTIASAILFALCCIQLHRRDQLLNDNRSQEPVPA